MAKPNPDKCARSVLSLLAGIEAEVIVHHEQFLKYAREGKFDPTPDEKRFWEGQRESIRQERFQQALEIIGLDADQTPPTPPGTSR
jgi:hypothetical protein